jgi:hypothetical protein
MYIAYVRYTLGILTHLGSYPTVRTEIGKMQLYQSRAL